MAYRDPYNQSIHDNVVRASRNTYAELEKQGYKVSINPDGEQNQGVGSTQLLYPDVIVWLPSKEDSSRGTAVIIEEVETESSVNQNEVNQWQSYAKLGVGKFLLIVPNTKAQLALQLVQQYKIDVYEIWYYTLVGTNINFTKYITLK